MRSAVSQRKKDKFCKVPWRRQSKTTAALTCGQTHNAEAKTNCFCYSLMRTLAEQLFRSLAGLTPGTIPARSPSNINYINPSIPKDETIVDRAGNGVVYIFDNGFSKKHYRCRFFSAGNRSLIENVGLPTISIMIWKMYYRFCLLLNFL